MEKYLFWSLAVVFTCCVFGMIASVLPGEKAEVVNRFLSVAIAPLTANLIFVGLIWVYREIFK